MSFQRQALNHQAIMREMGDEGRKKEGGCFTALSTSNLWQIPKEWQYDCVRMNILGTWQEYETKLIDNIVHYRKILQILSITNSICSLIQPWKAKTYYYMLTCKVTATSINNPGWQEHMDLRLTSKKPIPRFSMF